MIQSTEDTLFRTCHHQPGSLEEAMTGRLFLVDHSLSWPQGERDTCRGAKGTMAIPITTYYHQPLYFTACRTHLAANASEDTDGDFG